MGAKSKPLAYAGIRNGRYSKRLADGKRGTDAKGLPYAISLVLNPAFSVQDRYADDRKIIAIPSDQGYTGTYGCTGQDVDFELDLGQLIALDNGTIAAVKVTYMERFDLYFEYTVHPTGARAFTVKAWVLGVELGKPSMTHNTNTESVTMGDYQYPLTAYGETVMGENDEPYRDAEGFERVALIVKSVPGDADYANFHKAPPEPVKTGATPTPTPPDPTPDP